ncbi:MAG: HAD family hydrolase [Parcubacteria group bacterium]|nr:HAD family hydrolase [Parcubacteria group bacterium]
MIDARNLKCVIVDGDGVVFDTFATHWKFKLKLLGVDSVDAESEEAFRKTFGKIGREVNAHIFASSKLGEREQNRIWKEWRALERRDGIRMMPLADRALARLKMFGLKTVLCTNRATDRHYAAAARKSRLDFSLFDCVSTIGGSRWSRWKFRMGFSRVHPNHFIAAFPKPDARNFIVLDLWLRQQGISREEVLYVGDSLVDFEFASATGIKFIGVLTGAVNTPERWRDWCELNHPNIIPSIGDLPDRMKIF